MRKSHRRRLEIVWQAGMAASQLIANRLPHDIRARKTMRTIGLIEKLVKNMCDSMR